MKQLNVRKTFKRDFKKVSGYKNFKKEKFAKAIEILQLGETLPEFYRDHSVSRCSPKELQGTRIFHAAPNICVIYENTPNDISLIHIGSHQDLNLTECIDTNNAFKLRVKWRRDNDIEWK